MKQLKEYQAIIVVISFFNLGLISCQMFSAFEYKKFCKEYTTIFQLNEQHHYDKAIDRINSFENGNDSFIVLYQKAVALIGTGDTTSSLKLFLHLQKQFPDKVNINYGLAYLYDCIYQFDSSLYYSNIAIELKGGLDVNMKTVALTNCGITNNDIPMENIVFIRSCAYIKLGKFHEAKNDLLYCNYMSFDPIFVFPYLAYVYNALGQFDSSQYYQMKTDLLDRQSLDTL